ncbi:hypothetical protein AGMMS49928_15240 [Spirochaetia bacterium]|nr:hypothetical protein AGMMS49928_15240 [Spirochaetia bacterium]
MNFDPLLTKATRLARRRNFDAAVSALEAEEDRYYRSYSYYYLLGLCYLHTGIVNRAFSCFKQAREVKMQESGVLLALAVIFLKRGDTGRAVDFYLEVQGRDPKNAIARRGLKIIRAHAESISSWLESGQIDKLYPPLPKIPFNFRRLIVSAVAALVFLGLGYIVLGRRGIVPSPFGPPPQRPVPMGTVLEKADLDEPMQTGGSFRYVLTHSQVEELYKEARTLFDNWRDEGARIALNKILESNAADGIKNKARLLSSYLEAPGFGDINEKDLFTFAQVDNESILYRDCHVIWKGMATNVETSGNSTSFDFLAGYDTRRVMDGIVKVNFDFYLPVNTEQPLELLARVEPSAGEKGANFRLVGVALHQSGLGTPPKP